MERKKISWLLILQGWAMLWVVIGHSPLRMDDSMPQFAKILYNIAYAFHMPLFIFIAGYLFFHTRVSIRILSSTENYKRWTYKEIIIDKLKRLGIPFVVFTIIAMIMKDLFPSDMARPASLSIHEFIHAIIYPREGPLLEMWFVSVLMWMFILIPIWEYCLKTNVLTAIMVIMLLIIHLSIDYLPLNTFLSLRDTARFAVYFFIGMIAGKYGFETHYQTYKFQIIAFASLLLIGCSIIHFKFGVAISCILLSIVLAFALDKYYPKAFSSFRNYTYQIFLISIFVQIFIKMIYKRTSLMGIGLTYPILTYTIFYLACLLFGLYIPVFISRIVEKINWKPLLLSLGLKKRYI